MTFTGKRNEYRKPSCASSSSLTSMYKTSHSRTPFLFFCFLSSSHIICSPFQVCRGQRRQAGEGRVGASEARVAQSSLRSPHRAGRARAHHPATVRRQARGRVEVGVARAELVRPMSLKGARFQIVKKRKHESVSKCYLLKLNLCPATCRDIKFVYKHALTTVHEVKRQMAVRFVQNHFVQEETIFFSFFLFTLSFFCGTVPSRRPHY